jgi:nucleoside-diphosphate-sugar epimerase
MNLIFGQNRLDMTVLLTGSNGFLGSTIINVLKNEHKVVTLDRSTGEYQISLDKNVPKFKEEFNLIIHCAGKAHSLPKSEIEKKQYYQVNVIGTQNLLKGLDNSVIPQQFVFISSVSVYGQDFGIGIDESYELKATEAYGLSKIQAEKLVIEWCEKRNVICTILRLPLIIGPNPPGNLGALIKGIHKGYYFNIGGGKAKKSMVLAKDIANAINDVAKIGGIYNLTDGYHPSFAEISKLISIKLGKRQPISIPIWFAKILAKIGDIFGNKSPMNTNKVKKITTDLTFDDSKARKTFGWSPTPVLIGFELVKSN